MHLPEMHDEIEAWPLEVRVLQQGCFHEMKTAA